jgi:hypothetical protein
MSDIIATGFPSTLNPTAVLLDPNKSKMLANSMFNGMQKKRFANFGGINALEVTKEGLFRNDAFFQDYYNGALAVTGNLNLQMAVNGYQNVDANDFTATTNTARFTTFSIPQGGVQVGKCSSESLNAMDFNGYRSMFSPDSDPNLFQQAIIFELFWNSFVQVLEKLDNYAITSIDSNKALGGGLNTYLNTGFTNYKIIPALQANRRLSLIRAEVGGKNKVFNINDIILLSDPTATYDEDTEITLNTPNSQNLAKIKEYFSLYYSDSLTIPAGADSVSYAMVRGSCGMYTKSYRGFLEPSVQTALGGDFTLRDPYWNHATMKIPQIFEGQPSFEVGVVTRLTPSPRLTNPITGVFGEFNHSIEVQVYALPIFVAAPTFIPATGNRDLAMTGTIGFVKQ